MTTAARRRFCESARCFINNNSEDMNRNDIERLMRAELREKAQRKRTLQEMQQHADQISQSFSTAAGSFFTSSSYFSGSNNTHTQSRHMNFEQIINIISVATVVFTICLIVAAIGFRILPRLATRPPWWLSRRAKNFLGRFVGYGECKCCGDTWNWKKAHTTEIVDADGEVRGGVFPLCEDCWHDLAIPEEREPYYHKLFDEWMKEAPHHVRIRIEQEDRPKAIMAVQNGN